MEIIRSGTRPSSLGSADWFTGTVRVDPAIDVHQGSNLLGAHVTFEAGARTRWHKHPRGQVIIITFGHGLVQRRNGKVEDVYPGDVVWFLPEEEHWHGASKMTAMSHYAVQELDNGHGTDWLEEVAEEATR